MREIEWVYRLHFVAYLVEAASSWVYLCVHAGWLQKRDGNAMWCIVYPWQLETQEHKEWITNSADVRESQQRLNPTVHLSETGRELTGGPPPIWVPTLTLFYYHYSTLTHPYSSHFILPSSLHDPPYPCTMVQNNQESKRKHWPTHPSVRSFTGTDLSLTHSQASRTEVLVNDVNVWISYSIFKTYCALVIIPYP